MCPFEHKWTIRAPGITINNSVAILTRTSINFVTIQTYYNIGIRDSLAHLFSSYAQTGHFYVTVGSLMVPNSKFSIPRFSFLDLPKIVRVNKRFSPCAYCYLDHPIFPHKFDRIIVWMSLPL